MSDSVQPHRRQPTRLPLPWDSPGKNTGVGCHFLLQCMKVKSESEVAQSCLTQLPHGLQPTRLLRPWDFPGKSTGVGCHCLLSVSSARMVKYSKAQPPSLLVRCGETGAVTAIANKTTYTFTLWSAFPFLGFYPEDVSPAILKSIYTSLFIMAL